MWGSFESLWGGFFLYVETLGDVLWDVFEGQNRCNQCKQLTDDQHLITRMFFGAGHIALLAQETDASQTDERSS